VNEINFYMAKMNKKRHISILDVPISLNQAMELAILIIQWNSKEESDV
jgi:hypothetical protein